MLSKLRRIIIFAFLVVLCTAGPAAAQDVSGERPSLRVGVAPDYPPLIFKLNGKITGVDADLARRLGKELNRPVLYVELGWDELITALLEEKIDIIMSGMTITEARKVRINFTDPYLKSGLVPAIRAGDAAKYKSSKSIMSDYLTVGVIKNTTGEKFVRRNMSKSARIVTFSNSGEAATELKNRRLDVFIHDAPAVIWLVSENESDIRGVWEPLNEEALGWGVRKGDDGFLKQVNGILKAWREDGTLDEILRGWLPAKYLEHFK